MANPSMPRERAKEIIECVEKYLRLGHVPKGITPPPGEYGAIRMAFDELGKPASGSTSVLARAEYILKREVDWSLWQGPPKVEQPRSVPDGQKIRGTSTLIDMETGAARLQWFKTDADKERQEEMRREAMEAFIADVPPLDVPKGPTRYDKDIVAWFQIGDGHMGMLANEIETGENFDLKIAERQMLEAFDMLFEESPPCERCVINDLGDGTHYENLDAVTEVSGHRLDADGRYPKMVSVYSHTIRRVIDRALGKYKYVDIIFNQGNHSRKNDLWMAELVRVAYGKTDRLTVLNNQNVFIPYRMGNTFVMVHHGDKTKPEHLQQIMSNDFRQDWGETEYHYIDVGHMHHKWTARESAGCTIEMWNTLAPMDRYTHDHGFRSVQSITRVDRSKKYGEVGRRVLSIREIRDRIAGSKKGEIYIPPDRRKVFTV